jgi:hypothetical protein
MAEEFIIDSIKLEFSGDLSAISHQQIQEFTLEIIESYFSKHFNGIELEIEAINLDLGSIRIDNFIQEYTAKLGFLLDTELESFVSINADSIAHQSSFGVIENLQHYLKYGYGQRNDKGLNALFAQVLNQNPRALNKAISQLEANAIVKQRMLHQLDFELAEILWSLHYPDFINIKRANKSLLSIHNYSRAISFDLDAFLKEATSSFMLAPFPSNKNTIAYLAFVETRIIKEIRFTAPQKKTLRYLLSEVKKQLSFSISKTNLPSPIEVLADFILSNKRSSALSFIELNKIADQLSYAELNSLGLKIGGKLFTADFNDKWKRLNQLFSSNKQISLIRATVHTTSASNKKNINELLLINDIVIEITGFSAFDLHPRFIVEHLSSRLELKELFEVFSIKTKRTISDLIQRFQQKIETSQIEVSKKFVQKLEKARLEAQPTSESNILNKSIYGQFMEFLNFGVWYNIEISPQEAFSNIKQEYWDALVQDFRKNLGKTTFWTRFIYQFKVGQVIEMTQAVFADDPDLELLLWALSTLKNTDTQLSKSRRIIEVFIHLKTAGTDFPNSDFETTFKKEIINVIEDKSETSELHTLLASILNKTIAPKELTKNQIQLLRNAEDELLFYLFDNSVEVEHWRSVMEVLQIEQLQQLLSTISEMYVFKDSAIFTRLLKQSLFLKALVKADVFSIVESIVERDQQTLTDLIRSVFNRINTKKASPLHKIKVAFENSVDITNTENLASKKELFDLLDQVLEKRSLRSLGKNFSQLDFENLVINAFQLLQENTRAVFRKHGVEATKSLMKLFSSSSHKALINMTIEVLDQDIRDLVFRLKSTNPNQISEVDFSTSVFVLTTEVYSQRALLEFVGQELRHVELPINQPITAQETSVQLKLDQLLDHLETGFLSDQVQIKDIKSLSWFLYSRHKATLKSGMVMRNDPVNLMGRFLDQFDNNQALIMFSSMSLIDITIVRDVVNQIDNVHISVNRILATWFYLIERHPEAKHISTNSQKTAQLIKKSAGGSAIASLQQIIHLKSASNAFVNIESTGLDTLPEESRFLGILSDYKSQYNVQQLIEYVLERGSAPYWSDLTSSKAFFAILTTIRIIVPHTWKELLEQYIQDANYRSNLIDYLGIEQSILVLSEVKSSSFSHFQKSFKQFNELNLKISSYKFRTAFYLPRFLELSIDFTQRNIAKMNARIMLEFQEHLGFTESEYLLRLNPVHANVLTKFKETALSSETKSMAFERSYDLMLYYVLNNTLPWWSELKELEKNDESTIVSALENLIELDSTHLIKLVKSSPLQSKIVRLWSQTLSRNYFDRVLIALSPNYGGLIVSFHLLIEKIDGDFMAPKWLEKLLSILLKEKLDPSWLIENGIAFWSNNTNTEPEEIKQNLLEKSEEYVKQGKVRFSPFIELLPSSVKSVSNQESLTQIPDFTLSVLNYLKTHKKESEKIELDQLLQIGQTRAWDRAEERQKQLLIHKISLPSIQNRLLNKEPLILTKLILIALYKEQAKRLIDIQKSVNQLIIELKPESYESAIEKAFYKRLLSIPSSELLKTFDTWVAKFVSDYLGSISISQESFETASALLIPSQNLKTALKKQLKLVTSNNELGAFASDSERSITEQTLLKALVHYSRSGEIHHSVAEQIRNRSEFLKHVTFILNKEPAGNFWKHLNNLLRTDQHFLEGLLKYLPEIRMVLKSHFDISNDSIESLSSNTTTHSGTELSDETLVNALVHLARYGVIHPSLTERIRSKNELLQQMTLVLHKEPQGSFWKALNAELASQHFSEGLLKYMPEMEAVLKRQFDISNDSIESLSSNTTTHPSEDLSDETLVNALVHFARYGMIDPSLTKRIRSKDDLFQHTSILLHKEPQGSFWKALNAELASQHFSEGLLKYMPEMEAVLKRQFDIPQNVFGALSKRQEIHSTKAISETLLLDALVFYVRTGVIHSEIADHIRNEGSFILSLAKHLEQSAKGKLWQTLKALLKDQQFSISLLRQMPALYPVLNKHALILEDSFNENNTNTEIIAEAEAARNQQQAEPSSSLLRFKTTNAIFIHYLKNRSLPAHSRKTFQTKTQFVLFFEKHVMLAKPALLQEIKITLKDETLRMKLIRNEDEYFLQLILKALAPAEADRLIDKRNSLLSFWNSYAIDVPKEVLIELYYSHLFEMLALSPTQAQSSKVISSVIVKSLSMYQFTHLTDHEELDEFGFSSDQKKQIFDKIGSKEAFKKEKKRQGEATDEKKLLEQKENKESKKKASDQQDLVPDIMLEMEVNIFNAGIVILWPYIAQIFKMLGLTENNEFVSSEAQIKGVHALQYAASGLDEAEEHLLLLNKVICGVKLATPIPLEMQLTEDDKALVEQMLKGVLQNWNRLNNTSVEALRETFLMREGRLTEVEKTFNLTVEKKTLDILLESMPWSFGMIKLPWMSKRLLVEWI